MRVVALQADDTHELRRRLLYGHWAAADVHYPEDDLEGAFHLGVVDDKELVAIGSWYPQLCPATAGRPAYRLRGMAVELSTRDRGVGRLLFEAGMAEALRRGGEVVWANSRDSALGFYAKLGLRIVGEGFTAAGGIQHHVVLRAL